MTAKKSDDRDGLRLRPPFDGERTLDKMIAAGVVTPATERVRRLPRPVKGKGSASDLVADQRR
jgi:hypothetical protein